MRIFGGGLAMVVVVFMVTLVAMAIFVDIGALPKIGGCYRNRKL
jgi:hypothetical protein